MLKYTLEEICKDLSKEQLNALAEVVKADAPAIEAEVKKRWPIIELDPIEMLKLYKGHV